jgi:hypothetical protein
MASLLLSCEKRSGSHRANYAGFMHKTRWNFRYTWCFIGDGRDLEKLIHVPGILSLELESLYEKEPTCASLGHIETPSFHPEQEAQ